MQSVRSSIPHIRSFISRRMILLGGGGDSRRISKLLLLSFFSKLVLNGTVSENKSYCHIKFFEGLKGVFSALRAQQVSKDDIRYNI